jgi:hypothetical protein
MMLPPSCAIIPFFVTDTAGIVKEQEGLDPAAGD